MKEEELQRLCGEVDALIMSLTLIVTILGNDGERDELLRIAAGNALKQMNEIWSRHPRSETERKAAEDTIRLIFRGPLAWE